MRGRDGTALPSLAIVAAAVMWGLWWIPVRALDARGLDGDRASLALYAFAAAGMAPVLLLRRRRRADIDRAALATGALFGGMLVAWNHALLIGEVVRVTLLFYTAPIWATLFGFAFLGDRPTARRSAGIVLGLAGAAIILGASAGELPLPRGASDWLALAGSVMFAGSATITRRTGGRGELERSFVAFAAAALFAFVLVALLPGPEAADTAAAAAPAPLAAPLAIAAAVGVLYLIPLTWLVMWGAGRLDPGRVAILLLFEVLAAAVSAALLTDEPFGPRQWIGGALILSAALLEGRSAPPAPEHPVAVEASAGRDGGG